MTATNAMRAYWLQDC